MTMTTTTTTDLLTQRDSLFLYVGRLLLLFSLLPLQTLLSRLNLRRRWRVFWILQG